MQDIKIVTLLSPKEQKALEETESIHCPPLDRQVGQLTIKNMIAIAAALKANVKDAYTTLERRVSLLLIKNPPRQESYLESAMDLVIVFNATHKVGDSVQFRMDQGAITYTIERNAELCGTLTPAVKLRELPQPINLRRWIRNN